MVANIFIITLMWLSQRDEKMKKMAHIVSAVLPI